LAPDWLYKILGVKPREEKPKLKPEDYKVDIAAHGHCVVCGKPSAAGLQFCSPTCAESKKKGGMSMIWWAILFLILMYFLFAT